MVEKFGGLEEGCFWVFLGKFGCVVWVWLVVMWLVFWVRVFFRWFGFVEFVCYVVFVSGWDRRNLFIYIFFEMLVSSL